MCHTGRVRVVAQIAELADAVEPREAYAAGLAGGVPPPGRVGHTCTQHPPTTITIQNIRGLLLGAVQWRARTVRLRSIRADRTVRALEGHPPPLAWVAGCPVGVGLRAVRADRAPVPAEADVPGARHGSQYLIVPYILYEGVHVKANIWRRTWTPVSPGAGRSSRK